MKNNSPSWTTGIMVMLLILISGGYAYSYHLQRQIVHIWKQTLWEDRTNRMHQVDARKIYTSAPNISSDIIVESEGQTLHVKKDSIASYTEDEKEFLADQLYLLRKNPVDLENSEKTFQQMLKKQGLTYQTAVSFYNKQTEKIALYGVENVQALQDYTSFTYPIDIQGIFLLEGYVKGNWIETLVWGTGYYVVLFIGVLLVGFFAIRRRFLPASDASVPDHESSSIRQDFTSVEQAKPEALSIATPTTVPVTTVEEKVPEQTALPIDPTIWYDSLRYTLFYGDQAIQLPPKVFDLFYVLSQGEAYFQTYNYLFEHLRQGEEDIDKKTIEQLVFRLRKKLEVAIPIVSVEVIRARGCQLKGKEGIKLHIDRIENKKE